MKHLALFTLFCLLSGAAYPGTFELSDPAAEIMQQDEEAKEEAQADADTGNMPDYVADSVPEWKSEGIGDVICSDHLVSRKSASYDSVINQYWLQGFIDGVAYQRFITLGDHRLEPVYEPEELAAWIEEYCTENQPDSLYEAAKAFLKSLTD